MKSFDFLTMKSKQAWMKSKPYGFDEIKSVSIYSVGDFFCEADFIHEVDLFRRKTDLVEKPQILSESTVFSGRSGGTQSLRALPACRPKCFAFRYPTSGILAKNDYQSFS